MSHRVEGTYLLSDDTVETLRREIAIHMLFLEAHVRHAEANDIDDATIALERRMRALNAAWEDFGW